MMESENFFGNRGKSETGGNASLPQGGWTPLPMAQHNHATIRKRPPYSNPLPSILQPIHLSSFLQIFSNVLK